MLPLACVEHSCEQPVNLPVIWDALTLVWRHCIDSYRHLPFDVSHLTICNHGAYDLGKSFLDGHYPPALMTKTIWEIVSHMWRYDLEPWLSKSIHILNPCSCQGCSNMVSDWLADLLASNRKPGLITGNNYGTKTSVTEPPPPPNPPPLHIHTHNTHNHTHGRSFGITICTALLLMLLWLTNLNCEATPWLFRLICWNKQTKLQFENSVCSEINIFS